MDPIRPIGPRERDLEPVLRTPRPDPDARREQQEWQDQRRREAERRPAEPEIAAPPAPAEGDDPPPLIDVRV